MSVESKCVNCSKWSYSSGMIEDRCLHCGEYIDPQRFLNTNKKLTDQLIEKQSNKLFILENDNWITIMLKKTLFYLQISFISLVSFIIWLISLVAI